MWIVAWPCTVLQIACTAWFQSVNPRNRWTQTALVLTISCLYMHYFDSSTWRHKFLACAHTRSCSRHEQKFVARFVHASEHDHIHINMVCWHGTYIQYLDSWFLKYWSSNDGWVSTNQSCALCTNPLPSIRELSETHWGYSSAHAVCPRRSRNEAQLVAGGSDAWNHAASHVHSTSFKPCTWTWRASRICCCPRAGMFRGWSRQCPGRRSRKDRRAAPPRVRRTSWARARGPWCTPTCRRLRRWPWGRGCPTIAWRCE